MNWTEQADTMMKAWTEAQKQMWSGWYDLAQSSSGGQSGLGPMDPSYWLRQGMEAWTKDSGSAAQRLAGNLFGGQTAMMGMMDLLTRSWQVVGPGLQTGTPWQPDLRKFLDQWIEQATSMPERMLKGGEGMGNMLQTLVGDWMPLSGPWMAFAHEMMGTTHLSEALLTRGGLHQLSDLGQWPRPAISGLAEMPRVGVARETNAKVMRASDAMVELRKAALKYESAMAKAVAKAVEKFMEHLAELSQKNEQITSVRDLIRQWFRIADKNFTETFSSDEFIAIQNELSSAGMKYRVRQRELMEMVLTAMDIPTRREIDDAYRIIHDLKKEVRGLKKAMRASQSAAGEAPAKAAEAPRRTTRKQTASAAAS